MAHERRRDPTNRFVHRRKGRVIGGEPAREPEVSVEEAEEMSALMSHAAVRGDPHELTTWLAVISAYYSAVNSLADRLEQVYAQGGDVYGNLHRIWVEPLAANRDENPEEDGAVIAILRTSLAVLVDLDARLKERS